MDAIVLVALPVLCDASQLSRLRPSFKANTLLKFPGYAQSGLYGRVSQGFFTEWHDLAALVRTALRVHTT